MVIPAYSKEPVPESQEEALFVRRIIEFWRDEEYILVKAQARDFLKQYPNSEFKDSFWAMLGDIQFKDRKYASTLEKYAKIQSPDVLKQVRLNQSQCYYQLQKHSELIDLLRPAVEGSEKDPNPEFQNLFVFYYAEAHYRQLSGKSITPQGRFLCRKAQPYYSSLLESKYADRAITALAEISRILGEHENAAKFYEQSAQNDEDTSEDLLYQAASMQVHFDKRKATETFAKVFHMQGEKAADASYNWMLLMFGMRHFEPIIQSKSKLLKWVPEDKRSFLHFVLGSSHFALKQYDGAVEELGAFVNKERKPTDDVKEALLMTVAASYHLGKGKLLSLATDLFLKLFPEDPNLAKTLFFRVLTSKKEGNEALVKKDLQHIMKQFPEFEDIEAVRFEWCAYLYRKERWQECYDTFEKFIDDFPESSYAAAAQRYRLNASIYLVDNTTVEKEEGEEKRPKNSRVQMIATIQNALNTGGIIEPEQMPAYRLKLAKTLFELGEYKNAIGVLERYLEDFPESENLYQVHLLMALCYREGDKGLEGFTFHAEQALLIQPNVEEQARLHLNLFTGYLKLAKALDSEEDKARLVDKAAGHLYTVIVGGEEPVKLENRLWLANYYHSLIGTYMNESWQHKLGSSGYIIEAERAKDIFEEALGLTEKDFTLTLNEESLYLEPEIFKLATLYEWLGQVDKRYLLLHQLNKEQEAHPDWPWTLLGRTLLALGDAYEKADEPQMALKKYTELVSSKKKVDPYARTKAQLQVARLNYQALKEEGLANDNEKLMPVLKELKNLQIRKRLEHEPVHLEAAIDYAEISALTSTEGKSEERFLFHLNRVKEAFTLHEDIWSKDYDASRELHPDKDIVYQAYMMLIDALIAQFQAKVAREEGAYHEASIKEQAAHSIFETLVNGKFAISQYLVDKATTGLGGGDLKFLSQDEEAYERAN